MRFGPQYPQPTTATLMVLVVVNTPLFVTEANRTANSEHYGIHLPGSTESQKRPLRPRFQGRFSFNHCTGFESAVLKQPDIPGGTMRIEVSIL